MDADRMGQIRASRGMRAMKFLRGSADGSQDRDDADSVLVGALLSAAVLTTAFAAFVAFLWSAVDLSGGNTGGSKSDLHAYWFLPLGLSILGGGLAFFLLRRIGSRAALLTMLGAIAIAIFLLVVCPYY